MRDLVTFGDRSLLSRSIFDEMDKALNDVFGRDFFPSAVNKSTYPKMNIYDSEGNLCLDAYIPEVPKDKLSVSINEDGVLTLSGSSDMDKKIDENKFYFRELSRRSFSRSIKLPEEVDTDKFSAEHKDGMLRMKVPYIVKKEENRTKRIEIK